MATVYYTGYTKMTRIISAQPGWYIVVELSLFFCIAHQLMQVIDDQLNSDQQKC